MLNLQDENLIKRYRVFTKASPIPKAPAGHSWESLMELCLEQASKALACDEVPVGALLLDPHGAILGLGHNCCKQLSDITAHAEILAMRRAGQSLANYRLPGCYLVVTLEPCAMCAAAIVQARLAGVVFGAADQQAGAIVSRVEYLDQPCAHGQSVWHLGGVLALQCQKILVDFFEQKRSSQARSGLDGEKSSLS